MSRPPRWPEGVSVTAFLVAAGAAMGLAAVYALGGDPQAEGALLGVALAGIGVGLIVWAHHLLPHGPVEEPRPVLATTPEELEATAEDFERGGVITRRRLLLGSLVAALGALGAAAVFPIRSLGPSPDDALETTPWRKGRALVTADGKEVRAAAVPLGGLVTVFPRGHVGSADGQTVLIRIDPAILARTPTAAGGTDEGLVAFSKVCTHAGCPVGLYQAELFQLLCPCHQSAFDVLDRATPVFGPASRPLPQLPITVGEDGIVRALGDYPEPIGPGYWDR